uniref:Plac8 onzin related protein 6 n=1 Tax=Astyanax mexicanus TaxID=7994 RepID=A0A8B9L4Z6_ASTMX
AERLYECHYQPITYSFFFYVCVCVCTGCFGFWCPYCLMCNTTKKYGECMCLPLVELCFGGLIPPVTYSMRSSMRERYHIQGSMCDDCCVSTCCGICAWCQIARELKYRLIASLRNPERFSKLGRYKQAFPPNSLF